MKKAVRTLTIIHILFVYSFASKAQTNTSSMVAVGVASVTPKLCSCQMIELQSHDYKKQIVGIFAEKNQTVKTFRSYRVMNAMITKEKRYMYNGFVNNLRVVHVYKSHTDCMTLYYQLKQQNNNFRMYDILNVDALKSIARR
jgi:hypothetical protein